ncbi:MAG TPA: hypothetical protein VMU94_09105 [Streptosporangiaceae bacterium]|nr:hypothetical protein [Streptosporangiaceae bacterium]
MIIWHLLSDRAASYRDLGSGYYDSRTDKEKRHATNVRQLQALGYTVTLAQAA